MGGVKALELAASGAKTALDTLITNLKTSNGSASTLQSVVLNFFNIQGSNILQTQLIGINSMTAINGFSYILQTIFMNFSIYCPGKRVKPTLTTQDTRGACAIALSILNCVSSGSPNYTLPVNARKTDQISYAVLQGLSTSPLATSDLGFQIFGNIMLWRSETNADVYGVSSLQDDCFKYVVTGQCSGYCTSGMLQGFLNQLEISASNCNSDTPLSTDQQSNLHSFIEGVGQFIETFGHTLEGTSNNLLSFSSKDFDGIINNLYSLANTINPSLPSYIFYPRWMSGI